jgi:chorismate mutase
MQNKNINKIRKKLDKLDDSMLTIIKKRSILVNKILSEKKFKKEIIDNKRIDKILKRIKIKSKLKKIDTRITNAIWKSMIRAFINYEFRNFKKK